MSHRTATCACGHLKVTCAGEPVRVSICHCLDCQKRTGSAFSVNARFPKSAVTVGGPSRIFTRLGDSGNRLDFHFCPDCGTSVYWGLAGFPDVVAVAVGCFADGSFPAPHVSVYEARRHPWVKLPDSIPEPLK